MNQPRNQLRDQPGGQNRSTRWRWSASWLGWRSDICSAVRNRPRRHTRPIPRPAHSRPPPGGTAGKMPTLEQMKQIAEQKAAPVLEKLKGDPNNTDLLTQAGNIYLSTHQFKEAAGYFDRVLQVEPKNVAVRTQMASCMYYNGDVDGAISQLQQSLHYDPKDANSL